MNSCYAIGRESASVSARLVHHRREKRGLERFTLVSPLIVLVIVIVLGCFPLVPARRSPLASFPSLFFHPRNPLRSSITNRRPGRGRLGMRKTGTKSTSGDAQTLTFEQKEAKETKGEGFECRGGCCHAWILGAAHS
jgi:hypothetical protein